MSSELVQQGIFVIDVILKILGAIGGIWAGIPKILNYFSKPNPRVTDIKINIDRTKEIVVRRNQSRTSIDFFIINDRKYRFFGRDIMNFQVTWNIEREGVWVYSDTTDPFPVLTLGQEYHNSITFREAFERGNYIITFILKEGGTILGRHQENFTS